jgi:hypothetical protein
LQPLSSERPGEVEFCAWDSLKKTIKNKKINFYN